MSCNVIYYATIKWQIYLLPEELFFEIEDKPTAKKSTLLGLVATYVYLNRKMNLYCAINIPNWSKIGIS